MPDSLLMNTSFNSGNSDLSLLKRFTFNIHTQFVISGQTTPTEYTFSYSVTNGSAVLFIFGGPDPTKGDGRYGGYGGFSLVFKPNEMKEYYEVNCYGNTSTTILFKSIKTTETTISGTYSCFHYLYNNKFTIPVFIEAYGV